MPIIGNSTFVSKDKSISGKISQALSLLDKTADLDAIFIDKTGRPVVSRDFLEMVVEEFSQITQNPSFYNKFLTIDARLDKELRAYKADIKALLTSAISFINQAQLANIPIQPTEPASAVELKSQPQGPVV